MRCLRRTSKCKMLGLAGSSFVWLFTLINWQHMAFAKPYRGLYSTDQICTDIQTKRELFIGDFFTRPGQCLRVQCLGNLQLWEDSCQVPKLEGGCIKLLPANEYLDYPRCCPMYQCKIFASNENGKTEETNTYDHYGTLRKTVITQVFVITDLGEGKVASEGVKTKFHI